MQVFMVQNIGLYLSPSSYFSIIESKSMIFIQSTISKFDSHVSKTWCDHAVT